MSDKEIEKRHHKTFEQIKQTSSYGQELWTARDLQKVLEYGSWDKFRRVLLKAATACEKAGQEVEDHFSQVGKMVTLGSGAERKIEDFLLSRYACYLVVQNADPSKSIVAQGQSYFAIQTRRQELACVDGLKGFPEAIEAVFPDTEVQLCIVHMIRNSLRYVSYKERKELCADLKLIYAADTVEQAKLALDNFSRKWDEQYPTVSQLWRNNWDRLIPYFDFSKDIRKVIYTTNAIESVNRSLRKVLKTKGAFPHDESIMKIMYLALQNISKKWTMPIRDWPAAINQFAIKYEERFPL